MLKIDNNLLQDIGLGTLPEVEKNGLLKHIYETLEMRVGMRLADQMTNEQLDEFERYFEAKDDAGAFKWLETNFPNYKDIVQEEFEKLKSEVAGSAPQILAASQQAQAAAPATPQFVDPLVPPVMSPDQQQSQQPQYPPRPQYPDLQQPQQPVAPPPFQQQTQYPDQQPPAGPLAPQG